MKFASEELIHEHEAILLALKVLDEISNRLEAGRDVPAGDLRELIGFLRLFADTCHHGKEEGLLFPALEKTGIPRERGPIGVMLSEHVTGREFIKGMTSAAGQKTLDKKGFIDAARGYTTLLRAHISKENNILFPMGDARLTEEQHQELLAAFEEHEKKVMGPGRHEELHEMLHDFENRYLA